MLIPTHVDLHPAVNQHSFFVDRDSHFEGWKHAGPRPIFVFQDEPARFVVVDFARASVIVAYATTLVQAQGIANRQALVRN